MVIIVKRHHLGNSIKSSNAAIWDVSFATGIIGTLLASTRADVQQV
jgi:hypothetical protein